MKKFISKMATGIAAASLVGTMLAPAAFAQTVDISGNGEGSTNGVVVVSSNKCVVKQTSNTVAVTLVSSTASTGGNNANGNTGPGGVTINTGEATSTVDTTVSGGSNEAIDPCCGCQETTSPADVTVSGNGKNSKNGVVLVDENKKKVKQKSNTFALTAVKSKARTGKNTANGNTNGATGITTGAGSSTVTTTVEGGGNTL